MGGGKLFGAVAWEESEWRCGGLDVVDQTKNGKFSVKYLYNALELGDSSSFPSNCIWNVWVQPEISFFAWEPMWGKSLTLDLVQKRGWALANRCFRCHENEETIPVKVAQLVKLNTRKCGLNKWHMVLGLNPIIDNVLNLLSVGCCGAVSTPRFGSPWRV